MPELANRLKVEGWVARLWITPDHKPARVTVARKVWHIVARVDDVQFAKELPQATWKPTQEEESDVLELSPKDYGRFLAAIWGEKGKR